MIREIKTSPCLHARKLLVLSCILAILHLSSNGLIDAEEIIEGFQAAPESEIVAPESETVPPIEPENPAPTLPEPLPSNPGTTPLPTKPDQTTEKPSGGLDNGADNDSGLSPLHIALIAAAVVGVLICVTVFIYKRGKKSNDESDGKFPAHDIEAPQSMDNISGHYPRITSPPIVSGKNERIRNSNRHITNNPERDTASTRPLSWQIDNSSSSYEVATIDIDSNSLPSTGYNNIDDPRTEWLSAAAAGQMDIGSETRQHAAMQLKNKSLSPPEKFESSFEFESEEDFQKTLDEQEQRDSYPELSNETNNDTFSDSESQGSSSAYSNRNSYEL